MKKGLTLLIGISLTFSLISCEPEIKVSQYFKVTWVNYNDEVLQVDEKVKKDTLPEYKGDTPVKEENEEFTYEFEGWDPEVVKVTKNTKYTATFKAVAKEDWGPIHWFD